MTDKLTNKLQNLARSATPRLTLITVKERYELWQCTATAILREDKLNFGLGCPSIAVEHNTRCAVALTTSLNNTGKHGHTIKSL
eukprot:1150723-Pelagomonas_calceolata.AAC.2